MAINPSTEYSGKIGAPSAGYPYGQARNITVPGDGTGTPLEQKWLNDFFGMAQALLKAHGITPSGTPEQVGASQILQSLVALSSGLANLYTDSGIVNAYVLAPSVDNQEPASYFDGMEIIFNPDNSNTGATTVKVGGLAVADIRDKNGTALGGGELLNGQLARCRYSVASGWFIFVGVQSLDLKTETLPFTFAADADDTLTAAENLFGRILITGAVISVARNLIVSNSPRLFLAQNGEAFPVTIKTSAGTGISLEPAEFRLLYCDGVDIKDATNQVGNEQTWQNLTGSRAPAVAYYNTTGRPIQVKVRGSSAAAGNYSIELFVDGLGVDYFSQTVAAGNYAFTVSALIPPGSSYSVAVINMSVPVWAELR